MFVIRIIHIALAWYFIWYAYVKHGDTRVSVFLAAATPQSIFILSTITLVLNTAFADSIMVDLLTLLI